MKKLSIDLKNPTKAEIANLHNALSILKFSIETAEIKSRQLGPSTAVAIKEFQKANKLSTSGKLNSKTIDLINAHLADIHYSKSKTRVNKIHNQLETLNINIPAEEKKKRIAGSQTRKAIESFQKKSKLPVTGILDEVTIKNIQNQAIKKRYTTKTQTGKLQSTLLKALEIAKIDADIDEKELTKKSIGSGTRKALKKFQEKYNLESTGELDEPTLYKLQSVARSKGIRKSYIRQPNAMVLKMVTIPLSINKTSPQVADLQKAMSNLGLKISTKEFNTKTFGKTTREAVIAFQKSRGLPQHGQVDHLTKKVLNNVITTINPKALAQLTKYRIKGSVRNEAHERTGNMVIHIHEKLVSGESTEPLVTKKNHSNGFFDIPYIPPIDPLTGITKELFHLYIKLFNDQNELIRHKTIYNVSMTQWVNFNLADEPYKGETLYHCSIRKLKRALGKTSILDIKETDTVKQISLLSIETDLSTDEIMRLVLAHHVAENFDPESELTPEVLYAFIKQNLPASLPGDLLQSTNFWETFDQLVETTVTGIVFTDNELLDQVLADAVKQNLVQVKIKKKQNPVLQTLNSERIKFTLEKPILIGNAHLKQLLEESSVPTDKYESLAELFLEKEGVNDAFWEALNNEDSGFTEKEVKDLKMVVDLGSITKNHIPTLTFIKSMTGPGNDKKFKQSSDIAKLSHKELVDLIKENNNAVPENMPGENQNEQIGTYANVLFTRAEFTYPLVSLVSAVKKGENHSLKKIKQVEKFVDEHSLTNFKIENVDLYLKNNELQLDKETKAELKLFQRIHKISETSAAGKVLIDNNIHSSAKIYSTGKYRFTGLLEKEGVENKYAIKIFEQAKTQYAQIVAKITDYIPNIHWGNPKAIIDQTFTKKEIQEVLGDVPDLESLFGTLDFCECEHCKSLYGPAAYLTDLLRFLNEQDSLIEEAGKTLSVKDILFDRRPDLGNIKLNCENTNTPLPYIDLACEILENQIDPQQKDFDHQTTLSAEELQAIPQYIRTHAYEILASANYPIYGSFNLWQEEIRTYLSFLKVPRFELMRAFQDRSNSPNTPSDDSIAAEFFSIQSHEAELITTKQANTGKQTEFWGFNASQNSRDVATFMKRSHLSYNELIEFLQLKIVNPAPESIIERPADSCDIDQQVITNLSPIKLDLMHRFIRLWRKTGWKMWELDLLLRNEKIGNKKIDGDALVHLYQFKLLQQKFSQPVDILLTLYGNINTERRINPDQFNTEVPSLYNNLFNNLAITSPTDHHFELPLDNTIALELNTVAPHKGYDPTGVILSALTITHNDLDRLKVLTDNQLSTESLSTIMRYVYLAKGLKTSVKNLLTFLSFMDTANPFDTVEATLNCLKAMENIDQAGFSIIELDYILTYNPGSPYGLRQEALVQFLTEQRNIIENNEQLIEDLGLSEATINTILNFNGDSLNGLTSVQIMAAIQPLIDAIDDQPDAFSNANFSVDEVEYIMQYDANETPDVSNFIGNLVALQNNLGNVFGTNNNQIYSHIATVFGLGTEQVSILMQEIVLPGQANTLSEILSNKTLLDKNPDNSFKEINDANFPLYFKGFNLLHKISVLLQHVTLSSEDLKWFINHHMPIDTLDFSLFPVEPGAVNQYKQWLNMIKFVELQSFYPEPEDASLREVLELATDDTVSKTEVLEKISLFTQWKMDQLVQLDAGLQLKHEAGNLDFAKQETWYRLKECFRMLSLTGVNGETLFKWAKRDDTSVQPHIAQETRSTIKAKYDQSEWLSKIKPFQDIIRNKKREALVNYLIEHAQRTQSETIFHNGDTIPNPLYWKNSNDLYKYLLIDVEMNSCQFTSRIKQAISSVQLFVQRCFLNLESRFVQVSQEEKEDVASENSWLQWKWMKVYRIWEANRKVFFYPENWIEPELRDDKSPFFKELENELLQNEITHENVEAAYLSYLHKADEVSNLEICGIYHEMEDLNASELGYELNNVHVIGRTKTIPASYYYRKYEMNYSSWSAWEIIEVDIEGDQLVPVVYNRKLYLFWLVFMEKSQKVNKVPAAKVSTGSSNTRDTPEPRKMFEIQLAWTCKKKSGWIPKKVSKQKMIHPWERPKYSYNLKPHYKAITNELWLDIYISTSKEFNDTLFYDPIQAKKVKLSKAPFNETFRPWHSSSFVFNGYIKDLNLRGLDGTYYFIKEGSSIVTDSYEYVNRNFGADGDNINRLSTIIDGPRLRLPNGMHFNNTWLTNNQKHAVNNSNLRILNYSGGTQTLLQSASNPFQLSITLQDVHMSTEHPFFYQDTERSFFIKPEWQHKYNEYGLLISKKKKYRFLPSYHPYTTLFIRELNRDGIDGLLQRKVQTKPQNFVPTNNFNFNQYSPLTGKTIVDETAQTDRLDFTYGGSYSQYNWEIFFHAPMYIANKLSQNQRFEEAMRWYHYIFDPTNTEGLSTPQRYWITKPFHEYNTEDYRKQRIENILKDIGDTQNKEQLKAWRNNPFKPHLIARYRPVAYQRNVVMKYLDNLISWGDQLFRRDSIESINEASLLYMLAYEILGDRPGKVPNASTDALSFNELEDQIDDFGNATVDVLLEDTLLPVKAVPAQGETEPFPKLETFYFCIPNNDHILKYWDTIEDRLFKIRNCMNIEGITRTLPLFEPPIDPALLVKAAAAGVDLTSVLNDLTVGTPHYRFRILVRKAIEFVQDVKILGDKLLTALEKKDFESLAVLRSTHEIQLMEAVKEVRKMQIDEREENIQALNKTLDKAEERRKYHDEVPRMNEWEIGGTIAHSVGVTTEIAATIVNLFASSISMVPDGEAGAAGVGGSPQANLKFGGTSFGNAAARAASMLEGISRIAHSTGSMLETQGNYTRNKEANIYQVKVAEIDKIEISKQINAAIIRKNIAENELSNQELQIENAEMVHDYMKNKYTNEQLYNWMISQISKVYFQAYQLAYDMAKKAEKCYQYELGIKDSSFIQFGYWDSLKKGLLSGEHLLTDIRRMENGFTDKNKRELELTKHISLAQLSPVSLMKLKKTGKCEISLPEWLFNMDYPGHYNRRIKNIMVSVPCIAGPYTSINCTLSMFKSTIRVNPELSGGNYDQIDTNDLRFTTRLGAISSIATSHGQRDSGMFELNFEDERYLPFELMGVISDWSIEMPLENNQFDFSTVSDVIIHINYTAKDGGAMLATAANVELQNIIPDESAKLFSLKHEFPNEWYKFLHPSSEQDQEFEMRLKAEHFPFLLRKKLNMLKLKELQVFVISDLPGDFEMMLKATSTAYENSVSDISRDAEFNNTHFTIRDYNAGVKPDALGELRFKIREKGGPDNFRSLDPATINDIFIIIYTTS